jgi:hypothetical protein
MSDKYGEENFGLVPRGPFAGRPWSDVPALTLHSILNAVDFGFVELDERRVVAIREGLRQKDQRPETADRRPGE